MMALTRRQHEVLSLIDGFISANGYSPSYKEIAEACAFSSLATVHNHISNLTRKGFLARDENRARSIVVVRTPKLYSPTPTLVQSPIGRELVEALLVAKDTIHALHGDVAWEVYEECSPEMKQISAALKKAGALA